MFTTISKAGLGMYVAVIATIIKVLFNLDIPENLLLDGIFSLLQAIGFIIWVVGQITRKDLSWGIFRKNE